MISYDDYHMHVADIPKDPVVLEGGTGVDARREDPVVPFEELLYLDP